MIGLGSMFSGSTSLIRDCPYKAPAQVVILQSSDSPLLLDLLNTLWILMGDFLAFLETFFIPSGDSKEILRACRRINWQRVTNSVLYRLLHCSASQSCRRSRTQLSLMAKGYSWPMSGYGESSMPVLTHSWNWDVSAPPISKWSRMRATHSRAVVMELMLTVLLCRMKTFTMRGKHWRTMFWIWHVINLHNETTQKVTLNVLIWMVVFLWSLSLD